MSLTRCAIVNPASEQVVNVIEYEVVPQGDVPGFPAGYRAIAHETADARWTFNGSALIAPAPAAFAPSLAHVKAEAQRRIVALTGASDLTGCFIKQFNANMRANELNDKRLSGGTLTAAEESEAQALRDLASAIKAIRAKSNAIEAMSPIPVDYDKDIYWS